MHAHMHEAGRGRAVERGPVGDRVDIRREGERERGKEEKEKVRENRDQKRPR